jgi:hypothetical protein
MDGKLSLYQEVIGIAEDYFGPAASRYIDRLIIGHLGKRPQQLRYKDLPELFTWVKLTVAMVTDESPMIEEFMTRLYDLYEADLINRSKSHA